MKCKIKNIQHYSTVLEVIQDFDLTDLFISVHLWLTALFRIILFISRQ